MKTQGYELLETYNMENVFLLNDAFAVFYNIRLLRASLMYSQSVKKEKKKRNIPNNSNTNYRREMELVPINMDYYLLQFDASNALYGHGRII